MSCEIYDRLVATGLIEDLDHTSCEYEKGCPQTPEECVWGKILKAADDLSDDAAITEEDIAQSRELAILEAKASAKNLNEIQSILADSAKRTQISLNRQN